MSRNMKNPFISDGDSYVYDSDHSMIDDNMSTCATQDLENEGQYSIIRNEVRSTWPKRRPKYLKPHESKTNDESLMSQYQQDSSEESPINGSISEIICRDVDLNLNNLKDSLATLTQKLEDVSAEKMNKTNLDRRLLDENHNLQSKMKSLEQQLNQTDLNAREDFEKLVQNNALEMKRVLTSKIQEIDESRLKVSQLESEASNQRITCLARKNEVEKLCYEVIRLKEKMSSNDQQYNMLNEEFVRLKEITGKERDIYSKELEQIRQTVTEIQEKENVQNSYSKNLIPIAELQMNDLQNFIQQISQDNRVLRENIEELQGELLTLSIEEGRSLLRIDDNSWASESNTYTKPQLINLIVKEKEVNYKLRQYSDKLISKIIDNDPSILEI